MCAQALGNMRQKSSCLNVSMFAEAAKDEAGTGSECYKSSNTNLSALHVQNKAMIGESLVDIMLGSENILR